MPRKGFVKKTEKVADDSPSITVPKTSVCNERASDNSNDDIEKKLEKYDPFPPKMTILTKESS